MVVRIAVLVLALLVSHQLEGAVGDDLVRVHVGRRAGAALEHVQAKLVVQLAVDQFLAGLLHARQDFLAELPALEVRARGGHLHHRERLDQVGIQAKLHAGDVEILERARGLDAVVGVGGTALSPRRSCSRRVALVDIANPPNRCAGRRAVVPDANTYATVKTSALGYDKAIERGRHCHDDCSHESFCRCLRWRGPERPPGAARPGQKTEHRDPCHRWHHRRCSRERHAGGVYVGSGDDRCHARRRARYRGSRVHQGRADLERRLAGHELPDPADAGQTHQRAGEVSDSTGS